MIFTTISISIVFFQLQNGRQQRRQKSLELNITQIRAMPAVSSSNKAAETGSKKAGNMIFTKFQDFKVFPL